MSNRRFWLAGMVRGNREILEKSLQNVSKYFDGLIFVVDSRVKPEDYAWLCSIKGQGEIISKKWVNDHAHTSNEVLLCGKMQYGDYFVWMDETDQFNENFIKGLAASLDTLNQNDIGAIVIDHPIVIRYNDGCRVSQSPHWHFINVLGKTINYTQAQNYKKEDYVTNNRSLINSAFLHPTKYWFCYPAFSNHTQLLYAQFGQEVLNHHEQLRIAKESRVKSIPKV